MTLDIKLQKGASLEDVETLLSRTSSARQDVNLWLPTQLSPGLFKESWVVALVGTVARKGLTLVDWIAESTPTRDYYRSGLRPSKVWLV